MAWTARTLVLVDEDAAATQLSIAGALLDETERRKPFYHGERHRVTLTTVQEKLDEAEFAEAWEHCKRLDLDEAVALALAEGEPDA